MHKMHNMSKGSASPVVYLLTGYSKRDLPVSKLTPLINRMVVAEDPETATYNEQKPVLLKNLFFKKCAAGITSTLGNQTLDNESLATCHPLHARHSLAYKLASYTSATFTGSQKTMAQPD
ncbi:hypothetical protein GCM10009111_01060 [Colwellia asteriadis]|uniref:Uncharacterized protein n=1 Tax=Colwellia asteriadis TaxID=517723 RepID=A0ABN1L290_9GAMM